MSNHKSIEPKLWGPYTWSLIHTLSLTNDINLYMKFLSCLGNILPCETCKGHFKKMMIENPYTPGMYQNLYHYSYILHSIVNTRLGKMSPTLKDAYNKTILDLQNQEFQINAWKAILAFTTVLQAQDFYSLQCVIYSIKNLSPDKYLIKCLEQSNIPTNRFQDLSPWVCDTVNRVMGLNLSRSYYSDISGDCTNCQKP